MLIQTHNGKPYYVISMSGLQAFKRCRKSFDLGYVRNYEPLKVPEPVTQGADIHRHLAAMATGAYDVLAKVEQGDEMAAIAWAYGAAKPIPTGAAVISVEDPFFRVLIEPSSNGDPGVIVRCTFDLAYKAGQHVVLRDYKSFDRAPTLHVDLDFQGRLYSAFGMRYFKTTHVFFEYEYIRRILPHVPRGKTGGNFTQDECYVNVQLILSEREADALWEETRECAYDLVRALVEKRLYRTDLKAGPHACSSCFYRHGCVAEVQQGVLTKETAEMFFSTRPPITVPPNTRIE